MIRICTDTIARLEDGEIFGSFLEELSEERRKKFDRLKREEDRKLCLLAGHLMDEELKGFGFREKEMHYRLGEHGKPYFADLPELYFNISHSCGRVVAAFSDQEIGCDIEKVRKASLRISERFFCPEEIAFIEEAPEEKKEEAFFRIWTLKESFEKALGTGLSRPLSSFCVCPDRGGSFRSAWEVYAGKNGPASVKTDFASARADVASVKTDAASARADFASAKTVFFSGFGEIFGQKQIFPAEETSGMLRPAGKAAIFDLQTGEVLSASEYETEDGFRAAVCLKGSDKKQGK